MTPNTKKAAWALAAIAAFFALYIYARFDPADNIFPRCPFHWATGLKCPGCGSQRALHQLLNKDLVAAVRYNAALVISLLIILLLAEIIKPPRRHNKILPWAIIIIIALWWILRNIFGW